MEIASYLVELTDEQWTGIESLFVGMREYKRSKRELINQHDTLMGIWMAIFSLCTCPTIEKFCVDKGYRSTFIYDVCFLLKCGVDISEDIKSSEWWVVERTFAWLNDCVNDFV